MAGNPGALTTDGVPLDLLRTEVMDLVERHNETTRDWIGLLCGAPTNKTTANVRIRGMQFQRMGSDTTEPFVQSVPRYSVTLNEPEYFGLAGAITQRAWMKGMDAAEVRELGVECVNADRRLVTNLILQEMLTDGGWYAQSLTPPNFKNNAFDSTHDHYLGFNVSGIPTAASIVQAKHHITEHGYGDSLVCFLNNDQISEWEQDADMVTATAEMNSPLVQRLLEFGYTPSFQLSGVPIIAEDWVPTNYGVMFSVGALPLRWRIEDNAATANLMEWQKPGDAQYNVWNEFVRVGAATVVLPGAGVSMYFNSDTWADASLDIAA